MTIMRMVAATVAAVALVTGTCAMVAMDLRATARTVGTEGPVNILVGKEVETMVVSDRTQKVAAGLEAGEKAIMMDTKIKHGAELLYRFSGWNSIWTDFDVADENISAHIRKVGVLSTL